MRSEQRKFTRKHANQTTLGLCQACGTSRRRDDHFHFLLRKHQNNTELIDLFPLQMENKVDGEAPLDNVTIKGWNGKRTEYTCTDSVEVLLSNRIPKRSARDQDDSIGADAQIEHANGIVCQSGAKARQQFPHIFVSETRLSRDMSRIVLGAKDVRTITFPNTVREVSDGAFADANLLSAVLNEGLETLGKLRAKQCKGIFCGAKLR